MKKTIVGYVRAVECGRVVVSVPDNATDAEIEEAIYNAEGNGDVIWGDRAVNVTNWEESTDYVDGDTDTDD